MNISQFLPGMIAALVLAVPTTGFSRDKHDWHHDNHDWHHDNNRHWDHHFSNRYYRPYYGYGYGYPYDSYGYGYGYGYSPSYYYPGPSFGLSFSSRPYSSYPSSVYRGRVASGYSDNLAVDVQRELRRRGYYRGSIDGYIGPASRAAIRSYQAERRLRVTGRIDSSLLRSLGIG